MPDTATDHRTAALKTAGLGDISISVESIVSAVLAYVPFQSDQHNRNLARRWMCPHEIENAQTTDTVKFQRKQYEPGLSCAPAAIFTRAKYVLQRLLSRLEMQHGCTRRDLFERDQCLLGVQRTIVNDKDIRRRMHYVVPCNRPTETRNCRRPEFRLRVTLDVWLR